MKERVVKEAATIVDACEARMTKIDLSRYQLAYELAPKVGTSPHAVDKRLKRMFDGSPVDLGFVVRVANELGLRLTIGDDER